MDRKCKSPIQEF